MLRGGIRFGAVTVGAIALGACNLVSGASDIVLADDPGAGGVAGEPGVGGASTTATSGAGSTTGAGSTSGSGSTSTSTSGSTSGSTSTSGSGGSPSTGAGGSGGVGPTGCYSEGYDPASSLADLESSYSESQWLPTMLEVLARRYHNGWFVLDAMKTDPWLSNNFPSYFDLSSWDGMIESIDTACHEETHGWDFDQALSTSGKHVYYMGANLHIEAPKLGFFARNEILATVQQGGSVTSSYDSTYLTGTQGSYDFIFLADELTAYIIGLACATTVADHIGTTTSYRDGAASHLFYLQAYLKVARAEHPTLYAQWKADPDWQSFVRIAWARGHYWTAESQPYPQLGINDQAIWNRINAAENLLEIEEFTGEDPATVACTP